MTPQSNVVNLRNLIAFYQAVTGAHRLILQGLIQGMNEDSYPEGAKATTLDSAVMPFRI